MAESRRWFRVELSADGKVVSCREVERAEQPDGERVFYIRAHEPGDARESAYRSFHRSKQQDRRARLVAEGKCSWCGLVTDRAPGLKCTRCLKKNSEYAANRHARIVAKSIGREPPPKLPRASSHGVRHQILEEVLDAFQRAPNNTLFTAWLKKEIASARERVGLQAPKLRRAANG